MERRIMIRSLPEAMAVVKEMNITMKLPGGRLVLCVSNAMVYPHLKAKSAKVIPQ